MASIEAKHTPITSPSRLLNAGFVEKNTVTISPPPNIVPDTSLDSLVIRSFASGQAESLLDTREQTMVARLVADHTPMSRLALMFGLNQGELRAQMQQIVQTLSRAASPIRTTQSEHIEDIDLTAPVEKIPTTHNIVQFPQKRTIHPRVSEIAKDRGKDGRFRIASLVTNEEYFDQVKKSISSPFPEYHLSFKETLKGLGIIMYAYLRFFLDEADIIPAASEEEHRNHDETGELSILGVTSRSARAYQIRIPRQYRELEQTIWSFTDDSWMTSGTIHL